MTHHTNNDHTHIIDVHDILTHAINKAVRDGGQWLGFMYGRGFDGKQGDVRVDDVSLHYFPKSTVRYVNWQGGDLFFPCWLFRGAGWHMMVKDEVATALRELLEAQL